MGTGADSGGAGISFNTSFSDINSGLFGSDTSTSGSGTGSENTNVTQTESLSIDRVGLLKLIDDSLKGVGGLSEIFGQEAGAGLFNSSVAKKSTEDLLAKIAGELAKVTGTKTATNVGSKDTKNTSTQSSSSSGIFDSIF